MKLTIGEYQKLAARTDKRMNRKINNLVHYSLGMSSEYGELMKRIDEISKIFYDSEAFKKGFVKSEIINNFYRTDTNIVEEIGDMFWFAVNYCTKVGLNLNNLWFPKYNESKLIILADIADLVKKTYAYNKEIDLNTHQDLIMKMLRSLITYCDSLDINYEEVLFKNIKKLKARYPEKYSDSLALNRDVNNEIKAMTE